MVIELLHNQARKSVSHIFSCLALYLWNAKWLINRENTLLTPCHCIMFQRKRLSSESDGEKVHPKSSMFNATLKVSKGKGVRLIFCIYPQDHFSLPVIIACPFLFCSHKVIHHQVWQPVIAPNYCWVDSSIWEGHFISEDCRSPILF